MFTKTTLFKFALVPLAAVTLLAQVVSASPDAALQPRQDDDPSGDLFLQLPSSNINCRTGRRRLPKITRPNRDTEWRVGDVQTVRW